jgi:hypothetical protein
MKFFTNPFKKHDVDDYPDVLVTLGEAPHRASTEGSSVERHADEKGLEDGEARWGGASGSHTIESLRAEVDRDGAETGYDSIYDRMCSVCAHSR